MEQSLLEAFTTLYGTRLISSCVAGSSHLRPMRRLAEKTVFSGFVIACRRAICPTRTSPLSSKATTDGVRRLPSSLVMTLGSLPSMMATTELVVPRSMPMILPISRPTSVGIGVVANLSTHQTMVKTGPSIRADHVRGWNTGPLLDEECALTLG